MNTPEQIEQARQQLIAEDLTTFPSLFQQARNLAKQAWVSGTATLLEGKPLLTTAEKAYARLQICQQCEFYRDTRCLKCGCFMEKKSHVEAAQCPVNKWGPELQVMRTEEQLKTNISPLPEERIPQMRAIELTSYPEAEQADIKKLAEESIASYDGRFSYKGSQYSARLSPPDGRLIIYFITPKEKRRTIVDHLTLAEREQLNAIAKQKLAEANNAPTTFTFKEAEFQVLQLDPTGARPGIRLKFAPGFPGIPADPNQA